MQWVKDGMPLPPPRKVRLVGHHPALPFASLPAFMADLRSRNSISARALEFTILTAARTAEVTGARWSEIEEVFGPFLLIGRRPLSLTASRLALERSGY